MTDIHLITTPSWMQVGLNKEKWDYIAGRVYQSAKDMINKKRVPKYAYMYFIDPNMLKEAISETFKGPFYEWTCPECQIRVFGPKSWIHLHLPIHGKFNKREGRGGEHFKMKFHLD